MRSADVFLFDRPAGRLVESDEGGYEFRYGADYLARLDTP